MKLRHAAALALTGWYLMIPPIDVPGHHDDSAPISKWQVADSFDTAAACSNALNRRFTLEEKKHDKLMIDAYGTAACISTDDPRLKEK